MTGPKMPDVGMLALAVVGEFSKVQESIDQLVRVYVEKRASSLAQFLKEQNVLSRIPDQQRPRLVLAIADEFATPSDRARFREVFHRVKQVRDTIAHSAGSNQVDEDTLNLTRSFWTREGSRVQTAAVTRAELEVRLREGQWLLQHVNFIFNARELTSKITVMHQRVAFREPPADPADWDNSQVFTTDPR